MGDFIVGRDDGRYPSQTAESLRFFPAIGNHDLSYGDWGMRAGYLDYFDANPGGPSRLPNGMHSDEASYYDVRLGDIHLFSLDSEAIVTGGTGPEQLSWLAETASASDAPWKFAFFHHPPYSSAWHRDHVGMQWPFAELGIDAVFTGHDHVYERIQKDTNYFVVGTGGGTSLYEFFPPYVDGSNLRYNDNYGALFVIVSDDVATFNYFSIYGDPVDRFQIVKAVPEPSTAVLLILGFLRTILRRQHLPAMSRLSYCPSLARFEVAHFDTSLTRERRTLR